MNLRDTYDEAIDNTERDELDVYYAFIAGLSAGSSLAYEEMLKRSTKPNITADDLVFFALTEWVKEIEMRHQIISAIKEEYPLLFEALNAVVEGLDE